MPDHDTIASRGSDPLTTVITSLLALAAAGVTVLGVIYVLWWLIVFWAPF